jgi:radical SAM superfamily enzyme YgiQ (UPF0313 family)
MYKGVRFRRRPLAGVLQLVEREANHASGARRVFLADGDVMARPFDELEAILTSVVSCLPRVCRISTYANGSSILSKRPEELSRLRELRLHTLYMGLESGDEALLRRCCKGETAAAMADAGVHAQAAGLRMSVMVLLGLGGPEGSALHATATAEVLNRMQPRLLSALRVVPVAGTPLHKQYKRGEFSLLSEAGIVEELRLLVSGLELDGCVFRADHSSNVVPLEARFPRGKAALLAQLDRWLASGRLATDSPGPLPMWL